MAAPEAVERFRGDLERLTGGVPDKLGIAVSGGPDSLGLLLLAAAACPGRVEAATVDHGLRPEGAQEAAHVARISSTLGVPHATLTLGWPTPSGTNIQARAREGRYSELLGWALKREIPFIATAHHVDDQAETVLMRLGRGSGVGGLAGTRRKKLLGFASDSGFAVHVVRPLLGWRRGELAEIVAAARLRAVQDPTNRDERFDRTHARALLAQTPHLPPERIADSAAHLAEAEEALEWTARRLFAERGTYTEDGSVTLDASGLPRELQRRLLADAFTYFAPCQPIPGPKLNRLLDALREGRGGTLAGVRVRGGDRWRLDWAPPRRPGSS